MSDLVFGAAASPSTDLLFGPDAADTPEVVGLTDLVFSQPLPSSTNLVFGADEGGPDITPVYPASIDDELPLTGDVRVALLFKAQIDGVFDFDGAVEARYVSGAARPLVGQAAQKWQEGVFAESGMESAFQKAAKQSIQSLPKWEHGVPLPAGVDLRHQVADRLSAMQMPRWQEGVRLQGAPVVERWQETLRDRRRDVAPRWQEGIRLKGLPAESRWQVGLRDRRSYLSSRWQHGVPRTAQHGEPSHDGKPMSNVRGVRYQQGMKPPPGQWVPPVIHPPLGEPCYTPSGDLVFSMPWSADTNLVFVCERAGVGPQPGETIVIPIQRVYILDNHVTLTRADNGLAIMAENVGLSLDVGSWTWSFNATLAAYHLDDIQRSSPGVPVELLAEVNGHFVRVIVEDVSRKRQWGSTALSVSGRGVSGLLSAPYAPELNFGNDFGRDMQQLANDVLTDNGIPLGWDVDWRLEDWAVPAGVFRTSGTYMDALNELATAAGGYVQPHSTLRTLKFLKKYPSLPWDWPAATPDFELPSAAVTVEGIGWATKPLYNRVFVSGMQGGVTVDATRAGTAGLTVAPGITDALITAVAGGRARAESILADVGDQARIQLRTPVFPASGLILPGSLVRYVDEGEERIGLARAINVEASQSESWQTIEVETHA